MSNYNLGFRINAVAYSCHKFDICLDNVLRSKLLLLLMLDIQTKYTLLWGDQYTFSSRYNTVVFLNNYINPGYGLSLVDTL